MQDSKLDCLVVAPHPDDAELGMGGAIAQWVRAGRRVGVLDLTSGEPTPHGNEEIRATETRRATEILGFPWRENLELPNRRLENNLESRARLAEVFRRTRPRWVFAPFPEDAHPDHLAASELVNASRFWAKLSKTTLAGEPFHPERIFYYYCVHLRMHARPSFVLDISDVWPMKRAAIEAYESQFVTGRSLSRPTFVERLEYEARHWGQSIGSEFGEPFHAQEPLGLSSFDSIR